MSHVVLSILCIMWIPAQVFKTCFTFNTFCFGCKIPVHLYRVFLGFICYVLILCKMLHVLLDGFKTCNNVIKNSKIVQMDFLYKSKPAFWYCLLNFKFKNVTQTKNKTKAFYSKIKGKYLFPAAHFNQ